MANEITRFGALNFLLTYLELYIYILSFGTFERILKDQHKGNLERNHHF